jgi:uncharacterized protein YjbI with pentapeptide repeats
MRLKPNTVKYLKKSESTFLKKKTLAKPQEISEEEVEEILENHKRWLKSDGKTGKKALLNNANLQKAKLVGVNLQGAFLKNADMRNTRLDGIKGLSEAELQYANLEGATGLLGNEFGQADVTGTKLPEGIKEFNALETVKETSQNARKIFFAMLLGCVYSWLTIATTTDVRLLTNTASSPLPIIGTEIPIAWFYIAAPLVLIALYFYFHLYLDNLWRDLAILPAIFPDGKPLNRTAYPWLLNSVVCRHFIILKKRPLIARMKEWITIFLAWWVVPITMIAFWLRYIPRHDWAGTSFHILFIVVSVTLAIIFYRLCALTLQRKEKTVFRFLKFWSDRRFYYVVSVVVVGIIFSLLSYGAIEGARSQKPNFSDIKKLVPWAFEKFGYGVFADFREKRVSEIPTNYRAIAKEELLEFVKGANLKGRNLIYADMSDAFLVKADLRWALLNSATLQNANLQQADLRKANLKEAYLWEANLQHAKLYDANIQEANLEGAKLQQADLSQANLQQANLRGAILQQTYLVDSNLQKANLGIANLQQAQLLRANLQGANLWRANLQQADLRKANLKAANLSGVNLQQANLVETNLQEAHLNDADLKNANLSRAFLKRAKKITIEQLSQVKTLFNAILDSELMEQVKKCCPHLLEEPKEEKDQKN